MRSTIEFEYFYPSRYSRSEINYFAALAACLPEKPDVDWAKVAELAEMGSKTWARRHYWTLAAKHDWLSKRRSSLVFDERGQPITQRKYRPDRQLAIRGVLRRSAPRPIPERRPEVIYQSIETDEPAPAPAPATTIVVEGFVKRNPDIDMKIKADAEENDMIFRMELDEDDE